jgi:hypothetical protein
VKPGFLKPFPVAWAMPFLDGKNFSPLSPLFYLCNNGDILAFSGPLHPEQVATTDGPSIPQIVQSLCAATGGIWAPGDGHDALWRGYALVKKLLPDGSYAPWKRFFPDFKTSTGYFLEMMQNNGVPELKAQEAYRAVMEWGDGSFVQDLAMPIPDLPDIYSFAQPVMA